MITVVPINVRSLFRTSAFRLASIYAALFIVSVLVLFGILYWATIGGLSRQVNMTIESEIQGLAEQYERRGISGLVDVVTERVQRTSDDEAIFLITDSRLNRLAGNLRRWPTHTAIHEGRIEFDTTLDDGTTARFRARALSVGQNYRILVGRNIHEITQLDEVFEQAAIWGIVSGLLLALAGGVFMGLSAQSRIASINRTARRIMGGNLSERVPILGTRDEYDDLATTINEMLSQIELLLENVRHVGDSVAHDLKSPLTRLRNRLETLAGSGVPDAGELRKCVAESDRLLATFNALLRIARIESGAYRKEFRDIDVAEVVAGACDLYRAVAEEKRVELSFVRPEPVAMFGDRELLTQALANLLDNAVKYTPSGGRIEVSVSAGEDQVEIAIADNGSGVPAEDHARIQQRFVRLDAARPEPGNGLGLTLVRAVVDQHRGKLVLQNCEPGLKVDMRLPRFGRNGADLDPGSSKPGQ